jgi:hypothetical protein
MFMQSSRDSSVLRSLALSFGEGLAFSVGMKLTQGAARPSGARLETPDLQSVISAAIRQNVAERVEEQSAALRAQVIAIHRDFAETVAQIVAEQVAARAAALEPFVQERVAAAIAPLQAELSDLRARVMEAENTMAEFVSAISLMCQKAAARTTAESPTPAEPAMDLPIPAFAQAKPVSGTWRVPIASSFLVLCAIVGLWVHAL